MAVLVLFFADNLSLTPEQIEKKKNSAPKGTKLYKNKILGLRGRATGLVFPNFERARHIKSKEWAGKFLNCNRKSEHFVQFTAGLDTAYSQKSPDTIAMTFYGITNHGKCVQLDERVYNNAEMQTPIAPSDTVKNFIDFLDRNRDEWGFARTAFIDSADQATITEFQSISDSTAVSMTLQMHGRKRRLSTESILYSAGLPPTVILCLNIVKTRLPSLKFIAGERIKTTHPRTVTTIALTAVNMRGCRLKILLEVK